MRKKLQTPEGQLSLFEEHDEQPRPPLPREGAETGIPKFIPTGYYGQAFEVGFTIPELPSDGRAGWLSAQVYRDAETLRIGWPSSHEEADFYRRRIKRYLQSIEEARNDK